MTEHPILFAAPMVRAILEGKKTQTRRVVKPQPKNALILGAQERPGVPRQWYDADCIKPGVEVRCPFGRIGDRLWVRETFVSGVGLAEIGDARTFHETCCAPAGATPAPRWLYRADGHRIPSAVHWRPSIFMPFVAARILLEVTEVRAQRLQDITEADARAEGVEMEAVAKMLRERSSRARSVPCHWLTDGDSNEAGDDYCRPCAETRLKQRKEEKEQPFVDGGWDMDHDHVPFCASCGRRLSGALTKCGAETEIEAIRGGGFTGTPEECADALLALEALPKAFSARMLFQLLWDTINGKRAPWESNPWVWCVSFRRVRAP